MKVICYLALSLPIWHTDPEMKIRKYVSTQSLSGYYRAVVNLQIVEVKVICSLALSLPIWHTDPEAKMQKYVSTRVLSGFYDTVVGLQMFEVEVICYPALLGSYLAYGSRN